MKSKALDAKTLTVIMSNDDDDDDFQNPSEAIAITQNMILSSIKNPSRSQPLKPSGGALPPRKKQKSSVTNGKENQRVSKVQLSNCSKAYDLYGERKLARVENRTVSSMTGSTLEDIQRNANELVEDSRCSDDCDGRKAVKKERRQLSVSSGSEPVEIQSTFVSESCVSTVCDELKPPDEVKGESLCLLAPGDLNFADSCHSEGLDVKNVSEVVSSLDAEKSSYCSLTLDDSCGNLKLEVQGIDFGKLKGCEDTKCLKAGSVSYYSMSIESRLLESKAKPDKFSVQECSVDFEPGTQLNVLMDLCCGTGESVSTDNLLLEKDSFGMESCEFERDGLVQCPLCGTDISHLTEELRQVHTNDCLDKDGTTEIPVSVGALKPGSPRQAADVNPVLDWLRTLGLSKYEEIFIKEEVDWETLQWLTEEDLLNIGVVALGPRKKIVHALSQLRLVNYHGQDADKVISDITNSDNSKMLGSGNKLITEYFQGPAIQRNGFHSLNNARDGIEKSNKNSVSKKVGPRRNSSKGKVRDIPPWCCVPGTPFRVDAFRFLRGDCSHWFLTHFHMDHYQGLTRNFCHGKIYCSSITARLVHMKLGVPWERLQILPLNQKVTVAGINLTCLDANHCPGSVIILFEPPNGKAVLHTGDFRFSAKMASSSVLQSCHIHTLILDTTYCNPQYDFPKQEAVIQFVIDAIQAEAFNPKTLFLIGTYTIGKERLFLEVARLLKKKVYVGAAKLRLLSCLGLPEEDMQWFTANEIESHIHVVPMWTIASFKRMKHISRQYANRFNLIVTFSPTGWSFGKGKKKTTGRRWQQGTIIRYEVPYSEHSSFSELREFVQFISPQHIIPSVNNEGPESADAMIALLMCDPEN